MNGYLRTADILSPPVSTSATGLIISYVACDRDPAQLDNRDVDGRIGCLFGWVELIFLGNNNNNNNNSSLGINGHPSISVARLCMPANTRIAATASTNHQYRATKAARERCPTAARVPSYAFFQTLPSKSRGIYC